jgi:dTMP kinase
VSGRVIAFEGVDGAGKSTALELVAEHLRAAGVTVCLPRVGKEHSSRPIRRIRRLTRDRTNLELCGRAELLLYASREAQVLEQHVRPALARGETVLLDRSMLTPLVLGAYGRGLDPGPCRAIVEAATAGLEPDLTLIFDVHPRTSRVRKRLQKIRTRSTRNGGRKGLAGSGFKERIRQGYLEHAEREDLPVIHCERSTPEQIAGRVITLLEGGGLAQPEGDRRPWWQVDPQASFEVACESLPPLLQLYFTRRLSLGRELRAAWLEREPELTIWATDLDDPLLEPALDLRPELVLDRLARLPRAATLRERLADTHPEEVARSLVGVAGQAADQLRARLAERAPGAVVESLRGRSDAFAMELRERYWRQADAHERAASLRECLHPKAWRRRERLLEQDPAIAIPSLVGLAPERIDPILERYAEWAPKAVLKALAGRSDARAHGLRRALFDTGREVVDSISGLDDPDSWQLRERCVELWPSTVIWSLGELLDHPRTPDLLERCREAAPEDLFVKRRLYQLEAL